MRSPFSATCAPPPWSRADRISPDGRPRGASRVPGALLAPFHRVARGAAREPGREHVPERHVQDRLVVERAEHEERHEARQAPSLGALPLRDPRAKRQEDEQIDESEQRDDFAHVPGRIVRLTFQGEATYAPLLVADSLFGNQQSGQGNDYDDRLRVHGIAGLANAQENCWPMLLLGGASNSYQEGRGAFQEAPQVELARIYSKYAARPDQASRIPFYCEQAVRSCINGRPGASYLDFPDNFLSAQVDESEITIPERCRQRVGGRMLGQFVEHIIKIVGAGELEIKKNDV